MKELNQVVKSVADQHGFLYMDTMETALTDAGRALCDHTGVPAGLNFFAFNPKAGTVKDSLEPKNWTHDSLHPNEDGHTAMRNAAITWFNANAGLIAPPKNPNEHYTVHDIDQLLPNSGIQQCAPVTASSCDLEKNGWFSDQVHLLYSSMLLPMAVALIGAWLFVAPLMWFGRDRNISVAKIARCALSRPQSPPPC